MSLTRMYLEALAAAEARETPDAAGMAERQLKKGAAFVVRVKGREIQVILKRQTAPVGQVEERTFCKHFAVPSSARRQDMGRGGGWWRVVYTWTRPEPPPPADQLELQAAPAASGVRRLLEEGAALPEEL